MDKIVIKTNIFEIEMDQKGRVESLNCVRCGKVIAVDNMPFAYLMTSFEEKLAPTSVTYENKILTFVFDMIQVEISVTDRGEWLELALLTALPESIYGVEFGLLNITGFESLDRKRVLFSYALTENVNERMYPDADNGKSYGFAMTRFGTKGGRLAIVLCKKDEICDVLKKIHKTLSPSDRAISPIAGPYSREYHKNHGNYVINSDTSPEKLQNYIEFYTKSGVTQIDFHQGPNSFRQGDFYFHKYGGSAERFKNEFAKPLSEAGILSGLHTYAYYVDPGCAPILSDSKWHEQLCYLDDEYTLDEDFIPDQAFIKTVEDTSCFDTNHTFFSDSLPYVLIEDEIVIVKPENGGFKINGRGIAGTPHTTHKRGAKIRHFFGRFCMFTPIPGSELFFKIARDTAKAYNEGGFEMIYLDALDGIGHHCPKDEEWYWAGRFVSEIVKNCNTPPIIEYSTMYPSLWATRGRMGAWDTPYRGFKEFVKMHCAANAEWEKRHYTTTLGWYLAYPVMADKLPPNYAMRYQFEDDIDFVGTQGFSHGSSMVFISLSEATCNAYPAFEKNIKNYRRYFEAMEDEVLTALRPRLAESPFEKRLVEKDGEKYFVEKHYKKSKIYNASDDGRVLYENPFSAQKPFIRLEAQHTSAGNDGVVLVSFDENSPVACGTYNFDYTDMMPRLALRVRVKGNGKRSAVIFRIGSSFNNGKGVADYTVFTDFEGWRDIILAEVDNGLFPEASAPIPSDFGAYSYYRSTVNYDHANRLEVYTSGDVEGVSIGDVSAVPHAEFETESVTLSANGESFTLGAPIKTGEYFELYPDGTALKFDRGGNFESVPVSGTVPTLDGGVGAIVLVASSSLPARFTATVGFDGEKIK